MGGVHFSRYSVGIFKALSRQKPVHGFCLFIVMIFFFFFSSRSALDRGEDAPGNVTGTRPQSSNCANAAKEEPGKLFFGTFFDSLCSLKSIKSQDAVFKLLILTHQQSKTPKRFSLQLYMTKKSSWKLKQESFVSFFH